MDTSRRESLKTIVVDYDNTYTVFPTLITRFISNAIELGHTVLICTGRAERDKDWGLGMLENLCIVFYTDGKAKKPFLDALGITVDLWVDDSPQYILEDER